MWLRVLAPCLLVAASLLPGCAGPKPPVPGASADGAPVLVNSEPAAPRRRATHSPAATRDGTGLTPAEQERLFTGFSASQNRKGSP